MRGKLGTGVLSILLLGLLLATPVLAQSPSQTAQILLDPTPVEVVSGNAFTVTLKINNVPEPGMAAYDFKITFTPGVIQFSENKDDHEWPDPYYETPFAFNVDNAVGFIAFNDIFAETPAPSGDITLVVLHGTAVATESATTVLHFEKAIIKYPDGTTIPATVADGEVVVWVPVQIGISVEPTSVDFGSVIIGMPSAAQMVTVTNTGNVVENFSASIADESPEGVYTGTPGLTIGGASVSSWSASNIQAEHAVSPELVLTVPTGTTPGTYTATLVFWAIAH